MHRLLERLDGAASTIVPVAYLTGLLLGTMSYFAGITLDAGLAVGVALALAAELHSFLEQRRCRALWAAYSRASDEDMREHLASQLKAHCIILAALVTFSAVNATAFAAETWHPAPGFLPGWLQIGIRGAVVPVLFLLTGALSPLTASASDELAAASRHMLQRTIKATVKQWTARIERARTRGVDLAPVAVSLMLDAGDVDGARRVRLIAEGLDAAEGGQSGWIDTPALAEAYAPAPDRASTSLYIGADEPHQAEMPSEPPLELAPTQTRVEPADDTSQSSPPALSWRDRSSTKNAPPMLRFAVPEESRRKPSASATGRARAAGVRTPGHKTVSVEGRVRAVWQPGMSVRQVSRAAGVSRTAAAKYVKVLMAESGGLASLAARG